MSKRTQEEVYKLQRQAQSLLNQGCSMKEIATKLGVSVRTLQRWFEGRNPSEKLIKKIAKPQLLLAPSEETDESEEITEPLPELTTPQRLVETQEMPTIQEIQYRIAKIGLLAIQRLEYLLLDRDLSDMNTLKAIQLAGDWAAYSKGLTSNINLAISTVENFGLKVIDPSIKAEDANKKKGLTEEHVNEIKAKLLGIPYDGEFSDDYFSDDDLSDQSGYS